MQFPSGDAEITLIFDHLEFRPSPSQCEVLRSKLECVNGVMSVQLHTDWMRRQLLTVVYQRDIAPDVMLRKMAEVLRGLPGAGSSENDLFPVPDADSPAL
ncbi:MAG: hypothetical protein JWN70_1331 [Planctomycetaceae bacterium]|nr:hypothetical protein [Planctomycetaceae bacterium]